MLFVNTINRDVFVGRHFLMASYNTKTYSQKKKKIKQKKFWRTKAQKKIINPLKININR